MAFHRFDLESWPRREHFEHYLRAVPCSYSMTADLDITRLLSTVRAQNLRFSPVLIYGITCAVNTFPEFRTALDGEGRPGYFDRLNPSYTVFHPDTETFSCLWTQAEADFSRFYAAYLDNQEKYGDVKAFCGMNIPEDVFNISSIPWATFTGFNLNLAPDSGYLLPIFTIGKYRESGGKVLLPLAVQVHHAACDGFHVARFLNWLQDWADTFAG